MRIELLEILAEPESYLPFILENAVYEGDEIKEGTLRSPSGSTYPIINGIPRFVKLDNYTLSFGMQWNRFAKTQLDSATGCNYSRLRFENEVRWSNDWARERWVLDAGCGAGRFAEIAAELNCKLVAVDMSNAIDAAKNNLSRFSNVHFVQADLNRLPFRPAAFDGIYSIGVLQHTPNPYFTLSKLLCMLSPGGRFAVTIYARCAWTKLYSKYWIRSMTRNLSDKKLLQWIEAIMPVAFFVTDILFRIPVFGKFFQFIIPVANYVDRSKCLTKKQRYEEAVLDTFDMLAPKYDNPVIVSHVLDVLKKFNHKDCNILSKRPVNIIGQI